MISHFKCATKTLIAMSQFCKHALLVGKIERKVGMTSRLHVLFVMLYWAKSFMNDV